MKNYTSMGSTSCEDLNNFFQKVKLPQLSQKDKNNLDVSITEAEVRTSIIGAFTPQYFSHKGS